MTNEQLTPHKRLEVEHDTAFSEGRTEDARRLRAQIEALPPDPGPDPAIAAKKEADDRISTIFGQLVTAKGYNEQDRVRELTAELASAQAERAKLEGTGGTPAPAAAAKVVNIAQAGRPRTPAPAAQPTTSAATIRTSGTTTEETLRTRLDALRVKRDDAMRRCFAAKRRGDDATMWAEDKAMRQFDAAMGEVRNQLKRLELDRANATARRLATDPGPDLPPAA